MDERISVFRNFLRFFNCQVKRRINGLTESLREFCSSKCRGNLKTLIRNFGQYTRQCQIDSKLELPGYCGMKSGNRILNILDKNRNSDQDQSRPIRLRSNDFGMNQPKYECWEVELQLCWCGKHDTPSHLIFSCKKARKNIYWHIEAGKFRLIFDSIDKLQQR